jgi:hypothetical protein
MSFLPPLSPGNVVDKYLPSDAKFDSNYKWTRPTEWLDLNVPDGVPEKIIGLIAIFPNDKGGAARNYVTFNLDTDDSSPYTVDWGDGNVETVGSNVTVTHIYDYDDITSDTSTMKSTTFRGYRQAKFEVTLQGGARFGGSSGQINFNIDGPYVTTAGVPYRNGPNILDLFVSSSLATTPTINDGRSMKMLEQLELRNTSSNRLLAPEKIYKGCMSLQSIPFVPYVRNSGSETYLQAFAYCLALQYLPDGFADNDKYWFKNPSSMQQTFEYCYRLRYLPEGLFGDSILQSCSSFYLLFRECRNLRYIPYIGMRTSGGNVRVDYMFINCSDLKAIPKGVHLSNVSSASIDRMFYGCRECYDFSAIDLSALNIANGDFTQTFGNLDSLIEFPYIGNFTAANNVEDLFSYSTQLQRFNSQYTHLDFTNARDMRQTFLNCENLKELPPIHVTAVSATNGFYQTFYSCWSLKSVEFVGMTQGPSDGEYFRMFRDCRSLQYISGVDFSYANDAGDYTDIFRNCRNLARIDFPGAEDGSDERGFNQTVSLRYCPLNRDAIVNIFNHLVTTSEKTIDLRNNSYTSDLTAEDIQIANDKGWTVSI